MIITSTQRQVPVSPRKLQLLVAAVKHLSPQTAVNQLGLLNYAAAKPLRATLLSAIANAVNNNKLNADSLTIKEILINQGMKLRRAHAGSRGRSKPYLKRRSHITIKLEGIPPRASLGRNDTSTPVRPKSFRAKSRNRSTHGSKD